MNHIPIETSSSLALVTAFTHISPNIPIRPPRFRSETARRSQELTTAAVDHGEKSPTLGSRDTVQAAILIFHHLVMLSCGQPFPCGGNNLSSGGSGVIRGPMVARHGQRSTVVGSTLSRAP